MTRARSCYQALVTDVTDLDHPASKLWAEVRWTDEHGEPCVARTLPGAGDVVSKLRSMRITKEPAVIILNGRSQIIAARTRAEHLADQPAQPERDTSRDRLLSLVWVKSPDARVPVTATLMIQDAETEVREYIEISPAEVTALLSGSVIKVRSTA